MCKLLKYGFVFACGVVMGALGIVGGAYVMANKCDFDSLSIDDDADFEEVMCGAEKDD